MENTTEGPVFGDERDMQPPDEQPQEVAMSTPMADRLRLRAEWLETRTFAWLSGQLEREAAFEIERLERRVAELEPDNSRLSAERDQLKAALDGLIAAARVFVVRAAACPRSVSEEFSESLADAESARKAAEGRT